MNMYQLHLANCCRGILLAALFVVFGASQPVFAQTLSNGEPAVQTSIDVLDENIGNEMDNERADLAAQEQGQGNFVSPQVYRRFDAMLRNREHLSGEQVRPSDMKTVMFTLWEHSLLKEAEITYYSRDPDAEVGEDGEEVEETIKKGPREIILGGISYISDKRWTIWLNSQRITPKSLPPEVINLEVSREYVELQWFDEYTNTIYPIRLRPNERFNIDSQLFIPGNS